MCTRLIISSKIINQWRKYSFGAEAQTDICFLVEQVLLSLITRIWYLNETYICLFFPHIFPLGFSNFNFLKKYYVFLFGLVFAIEVQDTWPLYLPLMLVMVWLLLVRCGQHNCSIEGFNWVLGDGDSSCRPLISSLRKEYQSKLNLR